MAIPQSTQVRFLKNDGDILSLSLKDDGVYSVQTDPNSIPDVPDSESTGAHLVVLRDPHEIKREIYNILLAGIGFNGELQPPLDIRHECGVAVPIPRFEATILRKNWAPKYRAPHEHVAAKLVSSFMDHLELSGLNFNEETYNTITRDINAKDVGGIISMLKAGVDKAWRSINSERKQIYFENRYIDTANAHLRWARPFLTFLISQLPFHEHLKRMPFFKTVTGGSSYHLIKEVKENGTFQRISYQLKTDAPDMFSNSNLTRKEITQKHLYPTIRQDLLSTLITTALTQYGEAGSGFNPIPADYQIADYEGRKLVGVKDSEKYAQFYLSILSASVYCVRERISQDLAPDENPDLEKVQKFVSDHIDQLKKDVIKSLGISSFQRGERLLYVEDLYSAWLNITLKN